MSSVLPIEADRITCGAGVSFGEGSRIVAEEAIIGDDVVVEAGVEICGDRVEIGRGCRIGRRSRFLAPLVTVGAGTVVYGDASVEVNAEFRLGSWSQVGHRLRVIAQTVVTGERLWMTDDVVVGGGGARTDRAILRVGERVAIMDRCFLNVCRDIAIGDDTALSNGVALLTHSTWHPTLDGGSPVFAPIRIGRDVIAYLNAVVAPGVTIGDHVTIGANALVVSDVPDSSLAVGNPARSSRLVPVYPRTLEAERRDEQIRGMLADYALELPLKGVGAQLSEPDVIQIAKADGVATLRYFPQTGESKPSPRAEISLAWRPVSDRERGASHFDVCLRRMHGVSTPLAEDFRDFLRRRTVRIYTDRPFQPLALANIARLSGRLRRP